MNQSDYVRFWFIPVPILKMVCRIFGHKWDWGETSKLCRRCNLWTKQTAEELVETAELIKKYGFEKD